MVLDTSARCGYPYIGWNYFEFGCRLFGFVDTFRMDLSFPAGYL